MTAKKFRPQPHHGLDPVQHWQPRYRLTKFPGVYNIGSQLHYLAQHAPRSIRIRWLPAWRRFAAHYRKF
jgi:hypothetical protein